jgi:3-dehydroquinate dehydratase-2
MAKGRGQGQSAKSAARRPRVLVANGVNLDLLGRREVGVYGRASLAEIEAGLERDAPAAARLAGWDEVELAFFQSNDEARFLEELGKGWDGALINAGAWTHTSLALADRLKGLDLPFVELHLSNLAAREEFRHKSYSAPHAAGVVYGFGAASYLAALVGLLRHLAARRGSQS